MSVTTRRRGGRALAISVLALAGCSVPTAGTITASAPPLSQPPSAAATASAQVIPSAAASSLAQPPPVTSPAPPPGIGSGPGYPAGGPAAGITAAGCTLTEQGDPSVGNRYFNVHTTLTVDAPGEITINTADVEVLGPDGSQTGSLQVMPVSASSSTVSAPLVVTSGTVPFTGVADQMALSGQFNTDCKVVAVSFDDGNTAP